MPNPEYPAPDMPDSNEWLSLVRDDARDANAALRRIRRRDSEPYTRDHALSARGVYGRRVLNIKFGPTGRRALVGDDEPGQEAA